MLRVHRSVMRLLLCLLTLNFLGFVRADESFLKPNDVIALVGGEDMVVMSELGYLEAFAQWALPSYKLKFRSLAWEGDTVFEQRRDLNYPSLEAQLDKIGATVVIAQFGQMESLAGEENVSDFVAAYEKLISRLRGTSKRRLAVIEPTPWTEVPSQGDIKGRATKYGVYRAAIQKMVGGMRPDVRILATHDFLPAKFPSRDGTHLGADAQFLVSLSAIENLLGPASKATGLIIDKRSIPIELQGKLLGLVAAKNRLWFNYARPQNWAFLAGDRTNQPSSRDHIDRNKRWFPDELEKFVPLIEAKETEIWELAAKLKR